MFDAMTGIHPAGYAENLLYHIRVEQKVEREPADRVTGTNKDAGPQAPQKRETRRPIQTIRSLAGAGKKFKQCHGRETLANLHARQRARRKYKACCDERVRVYQAEKDCPDG